MGSFGSDTSSRARGVATGSIFSALAFVCLLAGGYISVGTFAGPIFAGICLFPVRVELNLKWALLCYGATSILAFLIVPDIELVLFFVTLFGYYPVLLPTLNKKIRHKWLLYLCKFVMFNLAITAVYAALLFLFAAPALQQPLAEAPIWYAVGMLTVANLIFFLYNILLDKVGIIYRKRIRKHLFK